MHADFYLTITITLMPDLHEASGRRDKYIHPPVQ